jgi:hypothetical protein
MIIKTLQEHKLFFLAMLVSSRKRLLAFLRCRGGVIDNRTFITIDVSKAARIEL